MNVLMQLRKVCNHPDLFEARSIESPFIMQERLQFPCPTLIYKGLMQYDPLKNVDYTNLNFVLSEFETIQRSDYQRLQELYPKRPLIEVIGENQGHIGHLQDKLLQARPLADGLAGGRRLPVNCNIFTESNTMHLKKTTLPQVLPFYDSNIGYLEEEVPPYLNTACIPFV